MELGHTVSYSCARNSRDSVNPEEPALPLDTSEFSAALVKRSSFTNASNTRITLAFSSAICKREHQFCYVQDPVPL